MATEDRRILKAVGEGLFQAAPFRQQLLIAGMSIGILAGLLAGLHLLPVRVGSQTVVAGEGSDISARAFVPDSYSGPPLQLTIGSAGANQSPPAGAGFVALRTFDVTLSQRGDGQVAHVSGVVVRLSVAAPADLSSLEGDASRLRLLHFRSSLGQWEDTHATIAGGILSGTVTDLSPFALGYFDPSAIAPSPESAAGPAALGLQPVPGAPAASPSSAPEPSPAGAPQTDASARAAGAPSAIGGGPAGSAPAANGVGGLLANPQDAPATIGASEPPDGPNSPDITVTNPAAPSAGPPANSPPSAPASTSSSGSSGPTLSVINLTTPGSGSAILSRSAFVPGDSWTYNLLVHNAGSGGFAYSLTVIPIQRSGLDQPEALGLASDEGLQLAIRRCSGGFAACSGQIYSGSLIVEGQPIGSLTSGSDDFLQISLGLPASGSNAFQGLSSRADLVWTAQQTS
jgi:hypothetical protein